MVARPRLRKARLSSRASVGRGLAAGAERAQWQGAQRVDQQRVDALGDVELVGPDDEILPAGLAEVVEPAEVGDPVGGQHLETARIRVAEVEVDPGDSTPLVPENWNSKPSVASASASGSVELKTRFHW